MDYRLAPIEVKILFLFKKRLQRKAGKWLAKKRKPFAPKKIDVIKKEKENSRGYLFPKF